MNCEACGKPVEVHGSKWCAACHGEPVFAQHEETGRMWAGPRHALPRRYYEITNDTGWHMTDEQLKRLREHIVRLMFYIPGDANAVGWQQAIWADCREDSAQWLEVIDRMRASFPTNDGSSSTTDAQR